MGSRDNGVATVADAVAATTIARIAQRATTKSDLRALPTTRTGRVALALAASRADKCAWTMDKEERLSLIRISGPNRK